MLVNKHSVQRCGNNSYLPLFRKKVSALNFICKHNERWGLIFKSTLKSVLYLDRSFCVAESTCADHSQSPVTHGYIIMQDQSKLFAITKAQVLLHTGNNQILHVITANYELRSHHNIYIVSQTLQSLKSVCVESESLECMCVQLAIYGRITSQPVILTATIIIYQQHRSIKVNIATLDFSALIPL